MSYKHICAQDHEECQDTQAVSRMVEDIRDALLDYQVCDDEVHVTVVSLTSRHLTDDTTTGDV